MGMAGRRIDEHLGVPGCSASQASAAVVEAAARSECTVQALTPGQYRLTRRYRRVWVMPVVVVGSVFLGLGLLFLLVPKVDEECIATVTDDRRGVMVALAGTAPARLLDDIRAGCASNDIVNRRMNR